MQSNKWVLRAPGVAPHVTCDLRLICLPPAGIGAFWVHGFEKLLPSNIELCPVELPGRNSRIREKPFSNMSDLVNAIIEGLTPLLQDENNTPYAFFGHSMGAWLAYAITKELENRQKKEAIIVASGGEEGGGERGGGDSKEHTTTRPPPPPPPPPPSLPLPVAIYASANRSPTLCGVHHDIDPTALHQLPPTEFWPAFEKRYGTNPDLKDAAVRKFVLPMLKADFSVIETYQPLGEERGGEGENGDEKKEKTMMMMMMMMKLPASIRLVVFGGEDDSRYTGDQLQAWKEVCSSSDDDDALQHHQWGGVHWFSGSHHFYNQSREMLVQFITDDLNHHCINTSSKKKKGGDLEDSVDLGGFGSPISSSTVVVVENSIVEIESVNKGMASPSPFEMNRDDDDNNSKEERGREEEEEGERRGGRVKASDTVPRPKPGCVYIRRRWCF